MKNGVKTWGSILGGGGDVGPMEYIDFIIQNIHDVCIHIKILVHVYVQYVA